MKINKEKFPYSLKGIEVDTETRWENGGAHDPRAIKLARAIAELDHCFGDDYFCWKFGGDGDNGEHLMYLLDIYFEAKDNAK